MIDDFRKGSDAAGLAKLNQVKDGVNTFLNLRGDAFINVTVPPGGGVGRVSLNLDQVLARIPRQFFDVDVVFPFTPSANWIPNQGTMSGTIPGNTNILRADLFYGGSGTNPIPYCGLTTSRKAGIIFYGGTAGTTGDSAGFLVGWNDMPPTNGTTQPVLMFGTNSLGFGTSSTSYWASTGTVTTVTGLVCSGGSWTATVATIRAILP